MRIPIYFILVVAMALPAWSQAVAPAAEDAGGSTVAGDRMLTPPPVSGQAYSLPLQSEENANSLRYGLTFSSAYSDNVLGAATGHAVSDVNYSIWPTVGIDQSTSRAHWDATYTPGFTFYQRTDQRNEADHTALLNVQYRLSPHVTFSASDTFQKSSSVFNQPGAAAGDVFAGGQGPNNSVVAPLADRMGNFATTGITYQYALNDMIGAGGTFVNLHYQNAAQVDGLSDASSQSGSAFYAHRFSHRHYLGAVYQYQRLMSYPGGLDDETQTHALFLFYTVYPSARFSLSFFGGPQYSDTLQPAVASLNFPAFSSQKWAPAGGAA